METILRLLISAVMLSLFLSMIIAHSWGFWRVYKKTAEFDARAMMWRGTIAGLTAWFWLCLAFAVWDRSSFGVLAAAVFWFYGLFFVPIIGMSFTVPFWKLIKWSNLDVGILGRAAIGLVIGLAAGASVGLLENYLRPENGGRSFYVMIFLIAPIAPLAAVMAGKKKLN